MLFLKAFILGFSVSAPIGPIGVLCIQRTLSRGKWAGFLTGFGAATANVIYATVAALGLSVVSSFLLDQDLYLRIIGSAFLFYLGIRTMLKKPAETATSLKGETLFTMYASTFLLMITNPATVLNFIMMFSGLGIDLKNSSLSTALILIGGVFFGAASWWILLSTAVSLFRKKVTPHLQLINKVAGGLILLLGVLALL